MVQLIGRVTKDAIISEVKKGKKVLNFSIAINDYYKPKNGDPVKLATYINCAYLNNPEKVEAIIKKGKAIEINGRISVGAYINTTGEAVGTLNFHVSNFKIYGNGNSNETAVQSLSTNAANKGKGKQTEQTKQIADDLPF